MPSNDVLSLIGDAPHFRWNMLAPLGTPVVVTYSFPDSAAPYADDRSAASFDGFSAAHQVYIRTALQTWSAAAGLTFVEVPAGRGDIRFTMFDMTGLDNATGNQVSGFGYYPDFNWVSGSVPPGAQFVNLRDTLGGDVFLNSVFYADSAASIAPGQRGYSILLHEIGHALGFKHPFQGSYVIDPAHDNGIFTIMSYDRPRSTTALGSVDREALAYLYGAPGESLTARYDARLDAVEITGPATASVLLSAWGGRNDIFGGAGADTIVGDVAGDWLSGAGGDDSLFGREGNDTLEGGAGADAFDGGEGRDVVTYEHSTRSVRIDLQDASLMYGDAVGDTYAGIEVFRTGDTVDQLRGDDGDNIFYAGGLSDRLYGRRGDDVLLGQDGADAFYGGLGADTMTGGDQADRRDRYIYFAVQESGVGAGNRDVITDFVSGEDRIEISRFDADVTQGGKQAFTFVGEAFFSGTPGELRYGHSSVATIVQIDLDGDRRPDFEIQLNGIMDLSEADFLI